MKNNKFCQFLMSVRLAIILLIIISILCILCTLIPQNQPAEMYHEQYGSILGYMILFLGFDHILSSFFMYITSILFAINLFLCTLRRSNWALKYVKNGGNIGAVGSPILHIGLCITLFGAVLSISMGRSTYYEIPVGKTANIVGESGDLKLTVTDFKIEYYEDEVTPKQYISNIQIKDDEKIESNLITQVNSPAKIDGLNIIQQSYGWMTSITLSTEGASKQITLKDNEWITLWNDGGEEISLGAAFYPDYSEENGQHILLSDRDRNPHLLWVLKEGETPVRSEILALNEQGSIFEDFYITFDGYGYYTGLQVKYDPGIPVIFTGFSLVTIGLAMRYGLGRKKEIKEKTK